MGERQKGCIVEKRLETIHPNPGPRRGRRINKTEDQKREREEREGMRKEEEQITVNRIGNRKGIGRR